MGTTPCSSQSSRAVGWAACTRSCTITRPGLMNSIRRSKLLELSAVDQRIGGVAHGVAVAGAVEPGRDAAVGSLGEGGLALAVDQQRVVGQRGAE